MEVVAKFRRVVIIVLVLVSADSTLFSLDSGSKGSRKPSGAMGGTKSGLKPAEAVGAIAEPSRTERDIFNDIIEFLKADKFDKIGELLRREAALDRSKLLSCIKTQTLGGDSLLHLAVYKKATSLILDLLLTYGVPIDIRNRGGDTPLYRAVEQGHFDLVKLFLDYGASMDFENSCGQSPYMFAIQRLGFDTPYHRPETYEPICKLFRDKKRLLSGLPVAA